MNVPRTITGRPEQLLFANWVQFLMGERLGPVAGWEGGPNSDAWVFKLADDRQVRLEIKAPHFRVKVDQPEDDRAVVREITEEARRRTQSLDLGTGVWYRTSFSSKVSMVSPLAQLHFRRLRSEHPRRRLNGFARFSNDVLFEFKQDPGPIGLPNFTVDATLRVPGPGWGPFTQSSASDVATMVRAVLAYSTAAPIDHSNIFMAVPADQDAIDAAQRSLADASVGEIVVDGINLAPCLFGEFGTPEQRSVNLELFRRVQGGLYAYEQALHQESEYLALVLLISAIEALSVPNVRDDWKRGPSDAKVQAFRQSGGAWITHGNYLA